MRWRAAIGRLPWVVALTGALSSTAIAQDNAPRRIASPVGQAIWCGDGAVAYTVEGWRGARADTGTFVRTLATGETRRVKMAAESLIACSPDGRFLVYRVTSAPAQTRLFDLASGTDSALGTNAFGYRWAANSREVAAWPRAGRAEPRLTPPPNIRAILVALDDATELVWAADRLAVLQAPSTVALADAARPTPGWQRHALPVQRAGNLRADRVGNLYVSGRASSEATTSSVFRCAAETPSACAPLLADYGDAFSFDVMPDGSLVFVSDRERNCLVVLDVRSGRHDCRLSGRWSLLGVSGDGLQLLITDPEGLLAVAAISGALVPR